MEIKIFFIWCKSISSFINKIKPVSIFIYLNKQKTKKKNPTKKKNEVIFQFNEYCS